MADRGKKYLGTYFEPEVVIRLARILNILAWVVAGIYAADFVLALGVFALQFLRGYMLAMGVTDLMQQLLFILERPLHGIVYFAVLQVLSKGLLIFLDVETNTRRAGRS